ncbi:glycerate kinase [Terrabacter sp. NPDC080008]|uniref:glycerate kinase n=1 Tax=Terrabacter sp. NPDC080008 TaxID=3155176 RepID=UPI00344C613C
MTPDRPLRVVVAPDSFKGTAAAPEVAAALARGWRRARPSDVVVEVPMADGGEGTLGAVLASEGASLRTETVELPGRGRHRARWGMVGDRAVVELAECCGLPLVGTADPGGADTEALGRVLAAALDAGAEELTLAVGGSASTDGGSGALRALGARVLDVVGQEVARGGLGLASAVRVDLAGLRPPPTRGVTILCDVTAPLVGPTGAARVFGPQKGANPEQVEALDRALSRWDCLLGGDAEAPGAGAAGGTAYGFATVWGATLRPGAAAVADLVGLDRAMAGADVVVTGEGRWDEQSLTGKVTGHVLQRAASAGIRGLVVAGDLAAPLPEGVGGWSLVEAAGGSHAAARADAPRWLERVGEHAARGLTRKS